MTDAARPEALERLWQRARAAWPSLPVERADFLRYLESRLGDAPLDAMERYCAEDLLLACACLHGVRGAAELFAATFGPVIEQAAAGIDGRREVTAEVRQALLVKLFVPSEPGGVAKIADYTGRGPLRVWLRMAGRRLALNALRDRAPAQSITESLAGALHLPRDVEMSLIRGRYEEDFRAALAQALVGLDDDERLVLRFHYVEGLSSSELAVVLRTSRASAHRRLAAARDRLQVALREALCRRLALGEESLDELLGLLSTRLAGLLAADVHERLAAPQSGQHGEFARSR